MRASGNPRGDRTRRRLLDATLNVIAEQGVRAVTQRRVSESAGVSVGLIPYYFSSTESLIVGALEELAESETQRLLEMRAAAVELGDDIEGLVGLLVEDVRQSAGVRRRDVITSFALTLEIPLGTVERAAFEAWEHAQQGFYEGVASAAGAADRVAVGTFLMASSDALALYSAVGTDPQAMTRAAYAGFDRLLRSLDTSPSPSRHGWGPNSPLPPSPEIVS